MEIDIIINYHWTKPGENKQIWALTRTQKADTQNVYIIYPTNLIGFLGGGVFDF